MDVLGSPRLVLDGRDCALLARVLARAIRRDHGAPGRPPPPLWLLDMAAAAAAVAGAEPAEPRSGWSGAGAEPAEPHGGAVVERSGQPDVLSVAEAAMRARVSEGYVRRMIRRGDLEASRDRRQGAYAIDSACFAAWCSARSRTGRSRKAA